MTDHPVSLTDLLAHAFRDADVRDAAGVAVHVAACPACASALARIALVRATVRADAAPLPAPAIAARVAALAGDRARALPAPAIEGAPLPPLVPPPTSDDSHAHY